MKICIIDDETDLTQLFSQMLENEGHDVVTANHGRTGLALLENTKFDVTLLDLSMPEFSGQDIINSLYESGKIKEQNIVIITGSTPSTEEWNNLRAKGVKLTLLKPIKRDFLLNALKVFDKQS